MANKIHIGHRRRHSPGSILDPANIRYLRGTAPFSSGYAKPPRGESTQNQSGGHEPAPPPPSHSGGTSGDLSIPGWHNETPIDTTPYVPTEAPTAVQQGIRREQRRYGHVIPAPAGITPPSFSPSSLSNSDLLDLISPIKPLPSTATAMSPLQRLLEGAGAALAGNPGDLLSAAAQRPQTPPQPPTPPSVKKGPLFSDEGPQLYHDAFQYNRRYATPGPYQTKLAPGEEHQFRAWVGANNVPFNPDAKHTDYDMRGYWKHTGGRGWSEGQHFPDTFKTPLDTTFSNQSRYAKPNAPRWRGNRLVDPNTGQVVFVQGEPAGPHRQQDQNPATALISSVPGRVPRDRTDPLGRKTLGDVTAGELMQAQRQGTLQVNKKGVLTTQQARQAVRALHQAQKQVQRSGVGLQALHQQYPELSLSVLQGYRAAARRTGVPPALLAGIEGQESNYGQSELPGVRSGSNFAGASGPFQIGTGGGAAGDWWHEHMPPGVNPYTDRGAALGAGKYLTEAGATADPSTWYDAALSYNHADWYAQKAVELAQEHSGLSKLGLPPNPAATDALAQAKANAEALGINVDGQGSVAGPAQKPEWMLEGGPKNVKHAVQIVGQKPLKKWLIPTNSGTAGYWRNIADLNPVFAGQLVKLAEATGEPITVTSGYRSVEDQENIDPGVNPKAPPGLSAHQFGMAADVEMSQRQAELAPKFGLEHGEGGPGVADPPHTELTDLKLIKQAMQYGPIRSGYAPSGWQSEGDLGSFTQPANLSETGGSYTGGGSYVPGSSSSAGLSTSQSTEPGGPGGSLLGGAPAIAAAQILAPSYASTEPAEFAGPTGEELMRLLTEPPRGRLLR